MSRIMLTGGTGFLGSRLTRSLIKAGHEVGLVGRDTSTFENLLSLGLVQDRAYEFFVTNLEIEKIENAVHSFKPDIVVHVAAISSGPRDFENISKQIDANIKFPSLILNAAFNFGCYRFVNTGTSWQETSGSGYKPFDFYSATKQSFENIIEDYVLDGLSCVTFRLFDVFGENDPRPKLLNLLNRIAQSGEMLQMSPGEQKIDLVHVDIVCEHYLEAISRLENNQVNAHEIYSISGENPRTLREIVSEVEKKYGKKINITWGGREYRQREVMDPRSRYNSILKVK